VGCASTGGAAQRLGLCGNAPVHGLLIGEQSGYMHPSCVRLENRPASHEPCLCMMHTISLLNKTRKIHNHKKMKQRTFWPCNPMMQRNLRGKIPELSACSRCSAPAA
jgi:hypothetical protein